MGHTYWETQCGVLCPEEEHLRLNPRLRAQRPLRVVSFCALCLHLPLPPLGAALSTFAQSEHRSQ